MSIDGRCPECGATLPEVSLAKCPFCGYGPLEGAGRIEVSPEQLMAELGVPPGAPFEDEYSGVVTSASGLLKTEPGQDAVEAPAQAERSRFAWVALAVALTAVLLVLALVLTVVSPG